MLEYKLLPLLSWYLFCIFIVFTVIIFLRCTMWWLNIHTQWNDCHNQVNTPITSLHLFSFLWEHFRNIVGKFQSQVNNTVNRSPRRHWPAGVGADTQRSPCSGSPGGKGSSGCCWPPRPSPSPRCARGSAGQLSPGSPPPGSEWPRKGPFSSASARTPGWCLC